jgi:hypothetical protein
MSFDPSKHLRKLGGKDYLEVKFRIQWFREDHPDGYINTELVDHDLENGFCLTKATAGWPGGGESSDYGSETKKDFIDYIEKANTKAIGRALGSLGYGTQFCDDFDFASGAKGDAVKVVDSPVERPQKAEEKVEQKAGDLATPAQIGLILRKASEQVVSEHGGKEGIAKLTKREASALIDKLK